jgi:5-(carboxyamino)imidazole ribonucleotide mutase
MSSKKAAKEDVFVVFGSATDSPCYSKIISKLDGSGVKSKFAVLSAHKTPKELHSALKKTSARIFVAGAGVAAALPGVIATETINPVIGIPCYGAYNGLDAFLSIHQMPPGVPVIGVGVEATDDAAQLVKAYLLGLEKIVLLEPSSDEAHKLMAKAEAQLLEMGIKYEKSSSIKASQLSKAVFIRFVDTLVETVFNDEAVVLNVPVKEGSTEDDALIVYKMAKKGYWVGMNKAENAAIAAVQLINLKGKYNKALNAYRKKIAKKVLDSNKEISSTKTNSAKKK